METQVSAAPPQRTRSRPSAGLTGFLGLPGVLADVVLGASICEDQADPGDVAPGGTSALGLREAVLQHVLEGQARHGALLHVLHLNGYQNSQSAFAKANEHLRQPEGHLHDGSLDLLGRVVHAEGELCPDAAGVLDQAHPGPLRRHVQRVHHLEEEMGGSQLTQQEKRRCLQVFLSGLFSMSSRSQEPSSGSGPCRSRGTVAHLVDKLLDQLKVLWPNAFGAVDQENQVDVGRLAG